MMDDLQQAYNAYQTALVNLPNPKEPRLWYGIGILYDRYGSLDHAEDAFAQVMKMQPDFDKAHEIYFRLGIIYKQQQKYNESLEVCHGSFSHIAQSADRTLCSVSSTSSTRLPRRSQKRTFGFRLAMSTSSRRTYV